MDDRMLENLMNQVAQLYYIMPEEFRPQMRANSMNALRSQGVPEEEASAFCDYFFAELQRKQDDAFEKGLSSDEES